MRKWKYVSATRDHDLYLFIHKKRVKIVEEVTVIPLIEPQDRLPHMMILA